MKKLGIGTIIGATLAVVAFGLIVFGTFQLPRTESVQHGYRGTGMDLVYHRAQLASQVADNALPAAIPPVDASGQKAGTIYKNLKVLGDVDISEFGRIMASMATWVAPTQSCNYCHSADGNFASDALYTKRVARRMLQMTRHINTDWKSHVAQTGVTCYTCHRGQPVPSYIWFKEPSPTAGMAVASGVAGDSALPGNPFTPFLDKQNEIRVVSKVALPGTDRQSIKQAEYTYALMIHMANSLGVNCTFCHNTRSFAAWDQSSPQRANAWYGIRMVRDLNETYLESLNGVFPTNRLGPGGDVPKVNCMTCHQGAYKPLLGASLDKTYPELLTTVDVASSTPAPEPSPTAAPAAPPAAPSPDTTPPASK